MRFKALDNILPWCSSKETLIACVFNSIFQL